MVAGHLLPGAGLVHEAVRLEGFWPVTYPRRGHEMLVDAHTPSYAALGGVARRGICDHMKTAVDQVKTGKGCIVNGSFATMRAHYLVAPDFCNVASGSKGVVEKNVQDCRRRIWIDAAKVKFGSFTELKAWLADWYRALWEEVFHPEYEQFSVAEMLGPRAGTPDAHAYTVRRLRPEAGAGVQHLSGVGGTQPPLGAVRTVRHDGQLAAASCQRHGGARRQDRGPPRQAEQGPSDPFVGQARLW